MNNLSKKFNCLIIGAGNIGGLYDNPDSEEILTHAHAYKKHQNCNLIGFVDSDVKKSQELSKAWGVESFNSLSEAFKNSIDIVSVATSDESHYEIIKDILLNYSIKLIFAEKPLCTNIEQAQELIELSKEKNIPILLNYTRRFVPELQELQEDISNNHFGQFLSGTGYYGKGILHNGSHMIDLLRFLLGDIKNFNCFDKVYDFYDDDPSISARINLKNSKSFTLNAIDCRNFTIFEADFIFEKARIRILDSGFEIEEYQVLDSQIYKNYKILNLKNVVKTSMDKAIFYAVDNVYNHLTNSQDLKCDIDDGLEAIKIPTQMIEEALK